MTRRNIKGKTGSRLDVANLSLLLSQKHWQNVFGKENRLAQLDTKFMKESE